MKNIHAFTETHTQVPGYISINEVDGQIAVSVRTRNSYNSSIIHMSREQLEAMTDGMLKYLDDTKPVVTAAVTINGKKAMISEDGPNGISYETLCKAVSKKPEHTPTITFSIPKGRDGSIVRGEFAPLVEGAVYNVMITGNA